ncbi:hypothetical protein FOZ63_000001, partial [Perkinsus olseni]
PLVSKYYSADVLDAIETLEKNNLVHQPHPEYWYEELLREAHTPEPLRRAERSKAILLEWLRQLYDAYQTGSLDIARESYSHPMLLPGRNCKHRDVLPGATKVLLIRELVTPLADAHDMVGKEPPLYSDDEVPCTIFVAAQLDRLRVEFLSVLANVNEHLSGRWSMQILTSHETALWLSSGLDVIEGVRAERRLLIRPVSWVFNHDTINKIMFNTSFWEAIEPADADKVLVFQSDSVMCGGADLDAFLEYEYIGAPWKHR